jgi:hypothetical protein
MGLMSIAVLSPWSECYRLRDCPIIEQQTVFANTIFVATAWTGPWQIGRARPINGKIICPRYLTVGAVQITQQSFVVLGSHVSHVVNDLLVCREATPA